jgi:hypothetical protein
VTFKDALKAPRVFIPIAGLAGSGIAASLALASHDQFPGFETMFCQAGGQSGCMEWSLLFFGAFYLIGYLFFLAFLFLIAIAPFAFSIAIWLWPMTKSAAATEGSTPKATRMIVWAALKDIIRGNEPNA